MSLAPLNTPIRRMSMAENMINSVERRKEKNQRRAEACEQGWRHVDLDDKKLRMTFEPEEIPVEHVLATLNMCRRESAANIFFSFMPEEFMSRWLTELENDYPGSFLQKRGSKRAPTKIRYTVSDMYQSLAMQILIFGKQEKPTENTKNRHALSDAFKTSYGYLRGNSDGFNILGADRSRRLQSLMCLKVGTRLEKELSKNFFKFVVNPGEVIACDEKVFEHDSEKSGMMRVIRAKNQKGLWNYTAYVFGLEKPFLL